MCMHNTTSLHASKLAGLGCCQRPQVLHPGLYATSRIHPSREAVNWLIFPGFFFSFFQVFLCVCVCWDHRYEISNAKEHTLPARRCRTALKPGQVRLVCVGFTLSLTLFSYRTLNS